MSRAFTAVLAAAALLVPTLVANAQSVTRIETRPVYGATMTVEKGVRVWRGLPPTGHTIINPGGKTPLSLSYNYSTVLVDAPVSGGGGDGGYDASPRVGYGWGGAGFGRYGAKRHHVGLIRLERHGHGYGAHRGVFAPARGARVIRAPHH